MVIPNIDNLILIRYYIYPSTIRNCVFLEYPENTPPRIVNTFYNLEKILKEKYDINCDNKSVLECEIKGTYSSKIFFGWKDRKLVCGFDVITESEPINLDIRQNKIRKILDKYEEK